MGVATREWELLDGNSLYSHSNHIQDENPVYYVLVYEKGIPETLARFEAWSRFETSASFPKDRPTWLWLHPERLTSYCQILFLTLAPVG